LDLSSTASTGDTVPINGVFTIPLSGQSFQDLLGTVGGGGTVTASFSGQFTATASSVPEPGTLSMMAIG